MATLSQAETNDLTTLKDLLEWIRLHGFDPEDDFQMTVLLGQINRLDRFIKINQPA